MKISKARITAQRWALEHASDLPGFHGAWIAGSTNLLSDDAELPASSDLDVMILLDGEQPSAKPGKFRQDGVLLEVSFVPLADVSTPGQVLGHYHLAGSLRFGRILADPAGHLTRLQETVSRDFADRRWVRQRCDQAWQTVLTRIDAVAEHQSFEEQVMSWLFAAGGVPHILLVAGLRNPTVRKRYVAVKELLADVGQESLYPSLLAMLDPRSMTSGRVSHHLTVLEDAFGDAIPIVTTPFPFAADISDAGRSVAIDGSRELIAQGQHREAIFWIVATFARCQMVFHADAPMATAGRWDAAFRKLLAELGIETFSDLERCCQAIRAELPRVMGVAEKIIMQTTTTSV